MVVRSVVRCVKISLNMATKAHGNRKFYDISQELSQQARRVKKNDGSGGKQAKHADPRQLMRYIDDNVIGRDMTFCGPFGKRKVVYCDYIASGRSLSFIEDFVTNNVLPSYGNTHTTTSVTSLQTTLYRHEARDVVRNAVQASEHDAVIFTGSGTTGAIHKLVDALQLRSSTALPPVVFVGPHEHHSNLLVWRECGAKVVRVRETPQGIVDLDDLEKHLRIEVANANKMPQRRLLVGCFSAASNVTGVLADDVATTVLLHQYGALAFWDYATAAPYVKVTMNPKVAGLQQGLADKDALFFSPHKFVGGVQTPGVLVAKKFLFSNQVPNGCGGGTVFFVTRDSHRYLQDVETREEGGTPDIVGSIRVGLVLQLKSAVTTDAIMEREDELCRQALGALASSANEATGLIVLGGYAGPRLPVFSFMVRHQATGLYLHHNYVAALLNDVFGIQARGGCACAGPYAHDLLGISPSLAQEYEELLLEDSRLDRRHLRRREEHSPYEVLRPGFCRISLPYFMSDEEASFVLEAIRLVGTEGWKLLPLYRFNPETAEWRHHANTTFRDRRWLGSVSFTEEGMTFTEPKVPHCDIEPKDYADCFSKARELFKSASKLAQRYPLSDQTLLFQDKAAELRWFLLPSEARNHLLMDNPSVLSNSKYKEAPFNPPTSYPSGSPTSPPTPPSLSHHHLLLRLYSPSEEDTAVEAPLFRLWSETENGDLDTTPLATPVETPQTPNGDTKFPFLRQESDSVFVAPLENGISVSVSDNLTSGHESISVSSVSPISDTKQSFENGHSLPTSPSPAEDLDSYVKGMTQEIASELKLELREMISQVEDLLITEGDQTKDNSVVSSGDIQIEPILDSRDSGIDIGALPGDGVCAFDVNQPRRSSIATDACQIKKKKRVRKRSGSVPPILKLSSWHSPPKNIFKATLEALNVFNMIRDGDRVLVCLSGGKDSLSLLHVMHQYQHCAKSRGLNFDLGAITVDPGSSAYDPRPLIPYLASLDVPYFYEEQGILQQAVDLGPECASICSFCSRLKRGRLYASARRNNYNVLAMGQHLDDLAESFLMSVFHNGRLRTMKANYTVKEGDLRVIRPFVFVREKDLRIFAETSGLPIIPENCPACFEAPTERYRMKQLLAQQEVLFPKLFLSLRSALHPLMNISQTGLEAKLFGRIKPKKGKAKDADDEDM